MMRWPSATSRPVVSVSRTMRLMPRSPERDGPIRGCGSASSCDRLDAAVGERVGAFVAIVPRVAPDPDPLHLVLGGELVEAFPEIGILHRLLRGRLPAAQLPRTDPFGDALLHVL